MNWKTVKLGELIRESRIPALNPNPDKRIRVKLNVLGVEKRPFENEISGATKQFERKAGQFIYGKQNFHKGAFGIIPKELDGFESSADIPSFDVRQDCLPEWIFYYFKIGNRYLQLETLARGVGSKRIHPEQIYDIELPLPPLPEQRKLIERFKAFEFGKLELGNEFIYQHTLLEQLRQTFLKEAIQGRLVAQSLDHEPACELLKKIAAVKERLIKEKKIKQGKIQVAEVQDEILFDIPTSWEWCKLDDMCFNITDGTHQTPTYTITGRRFLSAQNVKPFKFMPEEHKYVSEEAFQEYIKNRKAEKGDILVARVGAGIGEAAVVDREIDFCFYVSLGLIQPFKEFVDSEYLCYVINSPYGIKYAKGNISSKGGSAGNFNLGRIRSFLIPLPPVEEQRLIVKKLKDLLHRCKELEESICRSKELNENLLQCSLNEALRTEDTGADEKLVLQVN
jgi:type I restriction enzyme, S subunit